MSLLDGITDAIGGVVSGAIGDSLGGLLGGLDLSQFGEVGTQLVEQLGAGGITQLTDMLGQLNINPAELLGNLPVDQIGNLAGLVNADNLDGLSSMIGGLTGK